MERRGSFFPAEVHAPAGGREGRLGTMSSRIQSSLVYSATTTSTAEAAAITRASMLAPARDPGSTRVPPVTASATTARPSTTSTATSMELAEGLTTLVALGATQLAGATLAVETCSLPAGSQTTPGLTELAPQVVDWKIVIKTITTRQLFMIMQFIFFFETLYKKCLKDNFVICFLIFLHATFLALVLE